jgi:hypothetical protein
MSRDLTDFLWALVWSHFRPAVSAEPVEWTIDYDPACTITGTEDERIAYGLKMKSMAAKLGGRKATFADLWNCNTEALARSWPGNEGKPYDASSADQSLTNSLSFLFGNNCDAILRVMESHPGCQLRREKWNRPDYLRATITKACALPKRWPARRTGSSAISSSPSALAIQTPLPTLMVGPTVNAVIPAPPDVPVPALPTMVTNSKDKYDAEIQLVIRMLSDQSEALIGFDEFRARVMIAPIGTESWRPISDDDITQLRVTFAEKFNFMPIGKDMMRDALDFVGSKFRFDSAITWLNSLTWDGIPRVDSFLAEYCGAVDDEYTRSVSRYIWSGLAGRILAPGCQLDMVVALQSRQGTKKSTGLKLLAPYPDAFTDGLSLHEDTPDFKRLMRGKSVIEVAEMAGLSKADIGLVKRVITRTNEEWIEKYKTYETTYARRCMLFATTNEPHFLPADETGQRRWLPVEITELDRDKISANHGQLWAEGAAVWRESGIAWQVAERFATGKHARYEQHDVWEEAISQWLDTAQPGQEPPSCRPLALSEVLKGACLVSVAQQDMRAEKRAAAVMRQLGYKSQAMRTAGKLGKRWVREAPTAPPPPKFLP